MVTVEDIDELISERKKRILDYAQLAIPKSQFLVFRKLFLDELGNGGLLKDLERLLGNSVNQQERHGTGRNTLRTKGGVP